MVGLWPYHLTRSVYVHIGAPYITWPRYVGRVLNSTVEEPDKSNILALWL